MSNYAGLIALFVCAVIIYVIVTGVWNMQAKARLKGMEDLMNKIIRNTSHFYERHDEPLMESVGKAVDALQDRLRATTNIREKPETYQAYAGALASAMAEACVTRGIESGKDWCEPRGEDVRIDMPMERWRTIRNLADLGFAHSMPNYRDFMPEMAAWRHFRTEAEALEAESAIEKLEYVVRHRENDPEYSDSLSRNMLIWERWPKEKAQP
jgi:hypothetical protein